MPRKRQEPAQEQVPETRIQMRIDPERKAEWEAHAQRLGITLTAWINVACSEKIERDSKFLGRVGL